MAGLAGRPFHARARCPLTRDTLLSLSPSALRRALADGHPVDPAALDDTWYRGTSLGLWGWVEALTWKTFAKTFHHDPVTGARRGWNVRLHQDGLDAPARPLERAGVPLTFGHYAIRATDAGVLLDYGAGGNPWYDPSRLVRDPLVALAPSDPSRLLGYTCLALGGLRVPTPSWFLLERIGPLPFVPTRG